jgi:hypothetical protein
VSEPATPPPVAAAEAPAVSAGATRAAASAAPARAEPPAREPPAEPPAREPEPAAASTRAAVPGLEEARALARAGRATAALDAFRKLRVKYPDNPDVAYWMGNVYFDRMWWSYGFEAYRVAVSREPAYRKDRTLISNVLKSFVSERYGGVGARFIEREIGAAAIPYLEEATRSNSLSVRAHASRLLAKLNRAP